MISLVANLNWLAVLLAFMPYFLLGGLWFTVLFSKPYLVSLGKAGQKLENKPIFIIGPAICMLVITLASAILIQALRIMTIGGAVEFGLLVGIGYLAANTMNIAINPNIPRPILYGIISSTYHVLCIVLASCILVVMQ